MLQIDLNSARSKEGVFIKWIVIVVMNVIKVSCCGLCALLERLKVGDADIYLIILPMHLMQGKELAIFT